MALFLAPNRGLEYRNLGKFKSIRYRAGDDPANGISLAEIRAREDAQVNYKRSIRDFRATMGNRGQSALNPGAPHSGP